MDHNACEQLNQQRGHDPGQPQLCDLHRRLPLEFFGVGPDRAKIFLIELFNQHINDVVNRHDAQHLPGAVGDGQGQKIVARDQSCGFFLIGFRWTR